jgi:hypothetical protein
MKLTSSNLSAPLMPPDQPPAHDPMDPNNRDVKVWIRDVNGMRYSVNMPISSTFDDVMKKVRQEHGNFQGIFVGFEGGQNERTTVADMLTAKPNDKNEEDYLYEHPIHPKFKVRRV